MEIIGHWLVQLESKGLLSEEQVYINEDLFYFNAGFKKYKLSVYENHLGLLFIELFRIECQSLFKSMTMIQSHTNKLICDFGPHDKVTWIKLD